MIFPVRKQAVVETAILVDRVFVSFPEQDRGPKSMKLLVSGYCFNISDLKGFIAWFTVFDPKHRIAKIAFVFALVVFDRARNPCDSCGNFIAWGFHEARPAAFQNDEHLIAPLDSGFEGFFLAAPEFVREVSAVLDTAADDAYLKAERVGFGDVFVYCHIPPT
nr:hypothetical protein HGMM_F27F06C27 [uncultured Gammaproteobacteria bacterium]